MLQFAYNSADHMLTPPSVFSHFQLQNFFALDRNGKNVLNLYIVQRNKSSFHKIFPSIRTLGIVVSISKQEKRNALLQQCNNLFSFTFEIFLGGQYKLLVQVQVIKGALSSSLVLIEFCSGQYMPILLIRLDAILIMS